jgi:2-keto-4-pentenoate hydratase/2-oxohepta-3-ene-1,7-dioic acid hydratase in catechol pathway
VIETAEPLYLLKATTSVTAPGAVIERPVSYDGKTTYEGELGIGVMKEPVNTVTVAIDGIGELTNEFRQ